MPHFLKMSFVQTNEPGAIKTNRPEMRILMDKLIQQLVQIEESAEQMIEQANEKKKELSAKYEQKKIDYEQQVDAHTEEVLSLLTKQLESNHQKDVEELEAKSKQTRQRLDHECKTNGSKMAAAIVQSILDM